MIRRKERRPHCLLDRDRLGGEAEGQSGESLHPGFKRFQILQKNIQILQKIFIFYLGNPRWKAVICLWRGALGSTAVTNQINQI